MATHSRENILLPRELLVVTDIESDGPIPGAHSMLSIGAVATDLASIYDEFTINLEALPHATQHPDTMKWWSEHPDVWEAIHIQPETPQAAMGRFAQWLATFDRTLLFASQPDTYDYPFIAWYFWHTEIDNPFTTETGGPRTLDVRSFTAGALNLPYSLSGWRHLPSEFRADTVHTHNPIDDARQAAAILSRLHKPNN